MYTFTEDLPWKPAIFCDITLAALLAKLWRQTTGCGLPYQHYQLAACDITGKAKKAVTVKVRYILQHSEGSVVAIPPVL